MSILLEALVRVDADARINGGVALLKYRFFGGRQVLSRSRQQLLGSLLGTR